MKTNKNRYRIVVLTDLQESSALVLKNAVGFAQMIGGEIEVFYVKKPSEIVERENQLSAMRTINSKHIKIDKKIQNTISPIAKESGINIPYSFAFGNVKNEIGALIKKRQPDMIVLGKRKSSPFKLIGDGVTEFILNTYNGVVLITPEKGRLVAEKEFSLGTLNSSEPFLNLDFAEDLMQNIQKPFKSFKIINNTASVKRVPKEINDKTIEYVFEHNDGTIKNLSKYLKINNIDLLTIDRGLKDWDNGQKLMTPDINSLIGKLNVSLLISGKRNKEITN